MWHPGPYSEMQAWGKGPGVSQLLWWAQRSPTTITWNSGHRAPTMDAYQRAPMQIVSMGWGKLSQGRKRSIHGP